MLDFKFTIIPFSLSSRICLKELLPQKNVCPSFGMGKRQKIMHLKMASVNSLSLQSTPFTAAGCRRDSVVATGFLWHLPCERGQRAIVWGQHCLFPRRLGLLKIQPKEAATRVAGKAKRTPL